MDYVGRANQYIADVLTGKVPACKWVKAACERQRQDLKRKKWKYRFDKNKANQVCDFIECLHHIKGKWARAGKEIRLEPWQCFILTTVFGWVDARGLRRFRIAYTEVARKNAKSTIAAGLLLFLLAADQEMGAEVYSAATTREQAKIVFLDAQRMARKSSELSRELGISIHAHAIAVHDTDSRAQSLSADAQTLDGLNVHGAVIDELHAHSTRAVWDVIETATGSREQPLILAITTAGFDRSSICFEQRSYVEQILNTVLESAGGLGYPIKGATHQDETYFGIIYTLDEDDDWQNEEVWIKANPNLGVSVFADDLRNMARKAAQMPSAVSNFLTKRMNVWVGAETAWMNMLAWTRRALPEFSVEDFRGRPAILGLDLAARLDIAAVVGVILMPEDKIVTFGKFYCPEDRVEDSDNSQYRGWAAQGHLLDTAGSEIDFSRIMEDIHEVSQVLDVRMLAFDSWQATMLIQQLQRAGVGAEMIEVPMNVKSLSQPMKDLEAAVVSGRLQHDGNPVMSWMMSNVKARVDHQDNLFPVKSTEGAKIDGPVALLTAMHCLERMQGRISVYEDRGFIEL